MNMRDEWLEDLRGLERAGLRRTLRSVGGANLPEMTVDGLPVVQFASNNYLGLATHPRVIAAAKAALDRYGAGSGASPLILGHQAVHAELEAALAARKGSEAALVYASGSLANLGVLSCLAGADDQIFLDKLVHATLYDGARLSGAAITRFVHNDLGRLEDLLKASRAGGGHRIVVAVDGVYSMDGDIAPLPGLLALAERYGAILLVDEAHSTGVLGARGHGILEHYGLQAWPEALVLSGTLSKALGSLGGYAAGPRAFIDSLVNHSRAYIYATALPGPCAAAALEALQVLDDEPDLLMQLRARQAQLAHGLRALGWAPEPSRTPILPVLLGTPEAALTLQARLWEQGFFAPAIRPPTVAPKACRLRLSVSAAHSEEQVKALLLALGTAA